MLKVGDEAPIEIQLVDKEGKNVSLKDFLGQYIVLYFYPKDDTPGCTIEACEFRDFNEQIENIGAKIIGISKDNLRSHKKFVGKFSLNFTLLSDESTELQKAFGVWIEKSMFGKKYMGTQRSTFIIDPKGEIIQVWENVNPEGHAKEVYDILVNRIRK